MAKVLTDLSDDLASVVAEAGAGVARVEARRGFPATGIVWSADGVIVTAHHVIERETTITVGLPDGTEAEGTLAGRDPTTDLAVLRVPNKDLKPIALGEPESLKVGHLVLALGRPGESVRATLGIVSAFGDDWVTPGGGRVDHYLQTDVMMFPGFSGGSLVDIRGRTLGLNTSALVRGLSITVPLATIKRVVEALLAHGSVRRGYLGVGTQPVRLPEALATKTGQETGLLISSISEGSPAQKGGLFLGDVVLAVGGEPTRSVEELLVILGDAQIGKSAPVKIVRGGQEMSVAVTLGPRPS